jgi:hypothetical protein
MYTPDDVILVRRLQAICCVNTYIQYVNKKTKYGAGSSCLNRKLIVLTHWMDMLLRYDNPSNSNEEALNCITEAQMDHVIEQIAKMTGCKFYSKSTVWSGFVYPVITYGTWDDNTDVAFNWNDDSDINTNTTI